VSAFAAGCALCGAALDPLRAERRPSLADRLRIRRSDRRRGGSDQEGRQTAA
jgi:hypothetical protein